MILLARIRCPHYGHEMVKIIYGFPEMTTQLQKDIDDHKIYFIRGKKIPPPNRYCFHCKKDICYTFLLIEDCIKLVFQ